MKIKPPILQIVLIATLAFLSSKSAHSQTFGCSTNNGTLTITNYTGPGGAVTIPSTINGLPVVNIGAGAFSSQAGQSITSVAIPYGITNIGVSAFFLDFNLESVSIPSSVTSIGDSAFSYCNITNFTLPGTVSSIGPRILQENVNLTNLIIADGITSIPDSTISRPVISIYLGSTFSNNIDPVTFLLYIQFNVSSSNPFLSSSSGILYDKHQTTLIQVPTKYASSITPGSYIVPSTVTNIGYFAFFDTVQFITNLYFLSNAPSASIGVYDGYTFSNTFNGTVYYLQGTTGWGRTFMGATTIEVIPPAITVQPASSVVVSGTTAKFSVTTTGNPLYYYWLFDGATVYSGTNTNYSITNVQSSNTGSYSVVVSNFSGSVTSAIASLSIGTVPAITNQPQSESVGQGSNATLSVSASGVPSPYYQWEFNGTNISSATNSSFVVTNAQNANQGVYLVRVYNAVGSVLSSNASLTVIAIPTVPPTFQAIQVLKRGSVTLSLNGQVGSNYAIDFSSNLMTWTQIASFTNVSSSFQFFDSTFTNYPQGYYRARQTYP